jgi:hypothetical protein
MIYRDLGIPAVITRADELLGFDPLGKICRIFLVAAREFAHTRGFDGKP